eukprot:scaffold13247_cov99-Skeletonema_marinoi.AAC.1
MSLIFVFVGVGIFRLIVRSFLVIIVGSMLVAIIFRHTILVAGIGTAGFVNGTSSSGCRNTFHYSDTGSRSLGLPRDITLICGDGRGAASNGITAVQHGRWRLIRWAIQTASVDYGDVACRSGGGGGHIGG